MSARTGRPLAQGDVLWEPPADARERFELGRYLEWLRSERGLDFPGYEELWRWSISDLEAFWASIWDFYEVRSHAPYERVLGSREMPGAEWFPGARLNYAEHMLGRDEDVDEVAVVAYSQTREPMELTFGDLREQVARARAGLKRLGVGPATGSSPTCRTSRRRSSPSSRPRVSVRSGRRARRSSVSGASSIGSGSSSRRCSSRSRATATARSSSTGASRWPRSERAWRAWRPSSTCRTSGARTTHSRTPSPGTRSSRRASRSRSRRCRSRTRCTCSFRPARPACRRRSCTATAASCSST